MAKVGCFGPARSRLLSELRRRIDSSTHDTAQPRVWRYNPTAAYHLARRRETRMKVSSGERNMYSSCTIYDLLHFDDNDDDSTVSGDLSMAFYEASSVPLGMHLYDGDNEESTPAACRFNAFDDVASTAHFGSDISESQLPQENCSAKRVSFPKVTDMIGMESSIMRRPAKKFRHTLQNMKDWLLTNSHV